MSDNRCNDTDNDSCSDVEMKRDKDIMLTKQFRKDMDEILQRVKSCSCKCREYSLCVTKMQEAIMWLGMALKEMGTENPYPDSYNPENAKVAPTSDGLRM